MEYGVLAVRYAKALLAYSEDNGCADEVYSASSAALNSFAVMPALYKILDDPLLDGGEKRKLLLTACGYSGEDEGVAVVLSKFFALLIKSGREVYARAVFHSFRTLYREKHNLGVAKIVTAVPLDLETEQRILRHASAHLHKRIELEKSVDPAIEGGFILDVDDVRLDASVATQIRRIKQQLLEKNKRIV